MRNRSLFRCRCFVLAGLLQLLCGLVLPAQGVRAVNAATPGKILEIGTTFAPPFAMKRADGQWTGLSIDLWRSVAHRMGWRYHIVGMTFQQLLKRVQNKSLDAGVAAITVTAGRQKRMDFSQPFYVTGLAIAVRAHRENPWRLVLQQLFSLKVLALLLGFGAVLIGTGTLIWFIERRGNPGQFGGGVFQGIGSGMWWSAQTMTSVGYGDKIPQTSLGRAVGITWMIIGVIAASSFTASITSSLTVGRLTSPVTNLQSLRNVRVGTVTPSSSEDCLRQMGIKPRLFAHVKSALEALRDHKIDALLYDAPILRYLIRGQFASDIRILPELVQRQYYAIALPSGSPLRVAISDALLEEINSPHWRRTRIRYLGARP